MSVLKAFARSFRKRSPAVKASVKALPAASGSTLALASSWISELIPAYRSGSLDAAASPRAVLLQVESTGSSGASSPRTASSNAGSASEPPAEVQQRHEEQGLAGLAPRRRGSGREAVYFAFLHAHTVDALVEAWAAWGALAAVRPGAAELVWAHCWGVTDQLARACEWDAAALLAVLRVWAEALAAGDVATCGGSAVQAIFSLSSRVVPAVAVRASEAELSEAVALLTWLAELPGHRLATGSGWPVRTPRAALLQAAAAALGEAAARCLSGRAAEGFSTAVLAAAGQLHWVPLPWEARRAEKGRCLAELQGRRGQEAGSSLFVALASDKGAAAEYRAIRSEQGLKAALDALAADRDGAQV